MAVPTYDLMMRPVLELASTQDITRRIAEQAMRDHFHLTDEEMALRIPSGKSGLVLGRAGWAMTYLTKAGLVCSDRGARTLMAHRENRPTKVCAVCGRPFQWRKKWKTVWNEVKYCSERCRGERSRREAGKHIYE